MTEKLKIEQCKKYALEKNGECLSDIYNNIFEKLKWKCSLGHIWFASFNDIKKGGWCVDCSGCRKFTLEDCKEFAKKYNGECISKNYINNKKIMKWKCKEGHIFSASYNFIKRRYVWCHKCIYMKECKDFAIKMGGECLSTFYDGDKKHLKWKCAYGHEFFASRHSVITQKTWCQNCNINKYEEITRSFFEFVFKEKFKSIRPDWLKNNKTKRNLEIDGYCEKLNLAFEFQGKQHYEPIFGIDSLNKTIENDKIKKQICIENNVKLIIIDGRKYSGDNEIEKYVFYIKKIVNDVCKNDNNLKLYIKNIKLFTKESIKINYINELNNIKKMSLDLGLICVSNKYIDNITVMDFICIKNNHTIKIKPREIKAGCGCSECSGKARINMDKIKNFAKHKNAECLSVNYKNVYDILKWKCEFGHIFEKSYKILSNNKNIFCDECYEISKFNNIKNLCLDKKLILLDEKYNGYHESLHVSCVKKHKFTITIETLNKTYSGCRFCKKENKNIGN